MCRFLWGPLYDSPLKKDYPIGRSQDYDIDIPMKYLRTDGGLLIKFGFPNPIAPFELEMGRDKRVLATAVFKLSLNRRQRR
jgi:hypothetical protein